MKTGTTIRLLIAACLLAVAVWFAERRIESTAERRVSSVSLIRSTPADISRVELSRGEVNMSCFKTNGTWFLAWPRHAWVDEGELNRILGTIDTVKRREIITEAQRHDRNLNLSDYGLLDPRARVVVDGAGGHEEILIGDDTPLGEDVYARLTRETVVIAVSRRLLDVMPRRVESLRDPTLVRGEALLTVRLEIHRADRGFLQVARGPDGWMIHQPIVARANGGTVVELLDAIYGLKAKDFIWDSPPLKADDGAAAGAAPAPGAAMTAYGLAADEAVVRVSVWLDGGGVSRELFLGKAVPDREEEEVYARISGVDSVCCVEDSILDVLNVTADDLRDRNLFALEAGDVNTVRIEAGSDVLSLVRSPDSGWMITEPVQWKADDGVVRNVVADLLRTQIVGFVNPARTNLAEFGLASPVAGVLLQREPQAGRTGAADSGEGVEPAAGVRRRAETRQGCLWIGSETERGDTVYARIEGESHVYEIPSTTLERLLPRPADPLVYRDRGMLALSPEHVRRISLVRAGLVQTVEKGADGDWTADDTNAVIHAAVDDILFAVANLRAVAIESLNPEDTARYGLDRSEVTLTFGLSGEEGIQKSLIFGFPSKSGGIFAMVKGLDVVFVLDRPVVDRLVANITQRIEVAAP